MGSALSGLYTARRVYQVLAKVLPQGEPTVGDVVRYSEVGGLEGVAAQRASHFSVYPDSAMQVMAGWPQEAWDPDQPDRGEEYGIRWIRMRDLHHNAVGDEVVAGVVLLDGHLLLNITLSSTLRHIPREDGEDENAYTCLVLAVLNHYTSLQQARWADDPTRAGRDGLGWAVTRDKCQARGVKMVLGGRIYDLNRPEDSFALGALGLTGNQDDPLRRRKLTGKRLSKYRAGGAAIAEDQLPLGWTLKRDQFGRAVREGDRGLLPVAQYERVEALQKLYAMAADGRPWAALARELIALEADGKIARRSHVDPGATYAATAGSLQAGYDAAKSIFVRSNWTPASPPAPELIDRYEHGEDPEGLFDADTVVFLGKVELVRTGRYHRRLRNDIRGRGVVVDGVKVTYRDDVDEYGHYDLRSAPWPWPTDPETGAELPRFGISDEDCRRVGARLLRELRAPRRRTGGQAHQGKDRRVLQIANSWVTEAGAPCSVYPDEPTEWGAQARQNNSGRENFILITRRQSAGDRPDGKPGRRGWSQLGDEEGLAAHTAATGNLAELIASVAVALDSGVQRLLDPDRLAPVASATLPTSQDRLPGLRAKLAGKQTRLGEVVQEAEGLRVQAGRMALAQDFDGADRYEKQAKKKDADAADLEASISEVKDEIEQLEHDSSRDGQVSAPANLSVAAYLVAGLERAACGNGRGPLDLGTLADTVFTDWRLEPQGHLLAWATTARLPLREGGTLDLPLTGQISNVRVRTGKQAPQRDLVARYVLGEGQSLDTVATWFTMTRRSLLVHQLMPWLVEQGVTARGAKCALVDHPVQAVRAVVFAQLTGKADELAAWPQAWVDLLTQTYRNPALNWGDAACPDDLGWVHRLLATLDTPHAHRRGLPVTGAALALGVTERDIRELVQPQRRTTGFTRPQFLRYLPGSQRSRIQLIPCPHGCRRSWANHAALFPEVAASGYAVLCATCRRAPNTVESRWARIAFPMAYRTPYTGTGRGGSLREQAQTHRLTQVIPLAGDAVA